MDVSCCTVYEKKNDRQMFVVVRTIGEIKKRQTLFLFSLFFPPYSAHPSTALTVLDICQLHAVIKAILRAERSLVY